MSSVRVSSALEASFTRISPRYRRTLKLERYPLIPGAIYQIDRATGHATKVAPTEATLSAIVNVNDTIYAFNAWTGQLVVLDVTNGHTTIVTDVDPAAGPIAGAAPAHPAAPVVH